MEKIKNNKGITLIALVITIIVLLILAGISIATLTGENGVLTKASKAKDEQADATVKEIISLAWSEYQVEIKAPSSKRNENETKIASTEKVKIQGKEENYLATSSMNFLEFLRTEKRYIDENGVVNVENLTGVKLNKGNGTDGINDVYKVEETTKTYTLKYHENENKEKMLWEVNKSSNSTGAIDWDKIFAEAKPAEGQSESNTTIGLDSNGDSVNMDLWLYSYGYEGGYILVDESGCGTQRAYLGGFTESGEIIEKIPQYIKKERR